MVDPICIRFQVFEQEFIHAVRTYHWRTKWSARDLTLSLIVVFSCLWIWGTYGFSWLNLFCLAAGVSYLLVGNWFLSNQPKQWYRNQPQYHRPQAMWFADEGIIFRTGMDESRFQWSHYQETIETRLFFFMKYGKDQYTLVPKRAFGSYIAMEQFRNLVSAKMSFHKWK